MTTSSEITAVGNATRDVELRYTTGATAVATFGLACNRRYQKNGEWTEDVSFFNVVAWGSLAENAAASIMKGARVIVNGRLQQRSWETDEGEKRSVVEIIADDLGPSLRWAQAQIERTTRSSDGTAAANQRAGTPPKGGGGSGSGYGSEDYLYGEDDSEPFLRDARIGDL